MHRRQLDFYAQAFEFFRQVKRVQIDNDGADYYFGIYQMLIETIFHQDFHNTTVYHDDVLSWCRLNILRLIFVKKLPQFFC